MGDRIRREILKEKRAEYGAEILQTLSANLTMEFGRGFAEKKLHRMVQFAQLSPDQQIVVSLIRQLTGTCTIALLPNISSIFRRASFSSRPPRSRRTRPRP